MPTQGAGNRVMATDGWELIVSAEFPSDMAACIFALVGAKTAITDGRGLRG